MWARCPMAWHSCHTIPGRGQYANPASVLTTRILLDPASKRKRVFTRSLDHFVREPHQGGAMHNSLMRMPDAIQVAAARLASADAIVTNDHRWAGRVTEPLVVMLDDYLERG